MRYLIILLDYYLDFAQTIRKVVNGDSPIKYLPAVEDDPQKRKPDISRAKTYLDWEPKVSLETGLRKTIEYFRRELLLSSISSQKKIKDEEKELW